MQNCALRHFSVWVLFCVLSAILCLWWGQDAIGDLRQYHLYNVYALFKGRHEIDIAAAQIQTYLNPVFDIPYYVLTQILPEKPMVIAALMSIPYGTILFFGWRIAAILFPERPFGRVFAVLAVFIGASGAATFSQIGLTTNEVLVASFIIAALYNVLQAIYGQRSFVWRVFLAGFLAGFAGGGKLTAAVYCVGLLLTVMSGFCGKKKIYATIALTVGGVLGALITGAYWAIHLASSYGNPIFPYQNNIFASPFADRHSYSDGRFFPRFFVQWVFYPFWWLERHAGLVTEYPFADWRLALVTTSGILGAIFLLYQAIFEKCDKPRAVWIALSVFWVTSYVLWLRIFSIYRYVIPLEIVGGLLLVGSIRLLWGTRHKMAVVTVATVVIILRATTIYPDWGHIPFQERAVPVTPINIPENSLLVLAGDYPMSYVVAFVPPSVRAVGAFSNFVRPPSGAGTRRRIESLIANWEGPIWVARTRTPDLEARSVIRNHYMLDVEDDCTPITSVWDANALEICEARRTVPNNYSLGTNLLFASRGNGLFYVVNGWSYPENWGVWSLGPEASLRIALAQPESGPLLLSVTASGLVPQGSNGQMVEVLVDDTPIGHWTLSSQSADYQAIIPSVPGRSELRIRFRIRRPVSLHELGIATDLRPVGFGLQRLSLQWLE